MDMLYYIYIGNDRSTINHLSKVTGGMFMAVSSSNKAAKVIDSIRERYNTSILYEQNEPLKDSQDIASCTNVSRASISSSSLRGCRQKAARFICRQGSTIPSPPKLMKRASGR